MCAKLQTSLTFTLSLRSNNFCFFCFFCFLKDNMIGCGVNNRFKKKKSDFTAIMFVMFGSNDSRRKV